MSDELKVAKALIDAGEVVVAIEPNRNYDPTAPHNDPRSNEFHMPSGWQTMTADEAHLDAWRPGWGLILVCTNRLAVVDVDTKHGANIENEINRLKALDVPVVGMALTPSGGAHLYVPHVGLRTTNNTASGIDTRSSGLDGSSAGIVFLPGTQRPKYPGKSYQWVQVPDPEVADEFRTDDTTDAMSSYLVAIGSTPKHYADTFEDAEAEALPEEMPLDLLDLLADLGEGDPPVWIIGGKESDDRSRRFHHLVGACQRAGLTKGQTVTALKPWCEGVGKFTNRVATEVARSWKKIEEDTVVAEDAADEGGEDDDESQWWADLTWLEGGQPPEPDKTVYAVRDDGVGLFYPGKVNGVFGDPETAKSWLAHLAIVEALHAGERAAIVDADHNTAPVTARRLLALGVPATTLADPDLFRYAAPEDRGGVKTTIMGLAEWGAAVVVLDSLGELLPMMEASSNDNDEVTYALRLLTTTLLAIGACIIVIDHVTKSTETRSNGYAIGAGAKKRAVRGAYLSVRKLSEVVPGKVGKVAITIVKDSPGTLRAASTNGKDAGVFILDATNPEALTWRIETGGANVGVFRPTTLMERVSRWLEAHPGAHSRTEVTTNVEGKKSTLATALDVLADEEFVTVEEVTKGARIERRYSHSTLFTVATDLDRSPGPEPVPDRSRTGPRTPSTAPVPPVPPPLGGTGVRGGPGDDENDIFNAHTGPVHGCAGEGCQTPGCAASEVAS